MKFPLIGPAYEDRSLSLSAQECINLYVEKAEAQGRARDILHGTPGLIAFATPGTGPIRGMHVMNGLLYVVSATELYSVTTGGVDTLLGTVLGTSRVSMESNNKSSAAIQQLCIVNGSEGYIYDITNGLVQISSENFHLADVVRFIDTYFVFNWKDTHQFFMSNANNGTLYTVTDFGQKVTYKDNVISLIIDHKEVWLLGEATIEVWYNAGAGAGFPFVQIESAYIERGCAAVHSAVNIDNTIFWLGDDLVIYRAEGYNARRISTHAIEYAIKQYTDYSDAFGFTYTDEGHKFYVLTFPSGGTWVYDVSTSMWHQRKSFGLERWRANNYIYFNNKHYVGDYSTNNVYELDLDTYTEDGATIQRVRSSPYLHAESSAVYMDWLQIVIESGQGLTSGQGRDPQIMLQYSDDGARTWSNEKWRDMGAKGKRERRVRWTQLGRFYQRTYRVTITEPIKIAIIEADTSLDTSE